MLHRGDDARIGGKERTDDVAISKVRKRDEDKSVMAWLSDAVAEVGGAIASAALLFVFGAILLALATQRMDTLQNEIAARPMRTFAIGVIGLLVTILLIAAFAITIIGIPIAIIGALIASVAAYAGICAVLTVAGGALVRHKTRNPYVHLAIGCFLFMIAKALPFVGDFVVIAVTLLGAGTLVATRGAGFLPQRTKTKAA